MVKNILDTGRLLCNATTGTTSSRVISCIRGLFFESVRKNKFFIGYFSHPEEKSLLGLFRLKWRTGLF